VNGPDGVGIGIEPVVMTELEGAAEDDTVGNSLTDTVDETSTEDSVAAIVVEIIDEDGSPVESDSCEVSSEAVVPSNEEGEGRASDDSLTVVGTTTVSESEDKLCANV
jgi:hypothetical protein